MLFWILLAMLFIVVFGGLGVAVSPLFFILLVVAVLLVAGGGYRRTHH
jgi:hypothetical protein